MAEPGPGRACLCRHHPCAILSSRGRPAGCVGGPSSRVEPGRVRPSPLSSLPPWLASAGPGRAHSCGDAGSSGEAGPYRRGRGQAGGSPNSGSEGRRPPGARVYSLTSESADGFQIRLKLDHMTPAHWQSSLSFSPRARKGWMTALTRRAARCTRSLVDLDRQGAARSQRPSRRQKRAIRGPRGRAGAASAQPHSNCRPVMGR
jgi:hypothetical protein